MFTLQAGKQHAVVYENRAQDSRVTECEVSPQINAKAGTGGGNLPLAITPMVFEPRFARNGRGAPEEVCPPLKAQSGETGKGDAAPVVVFTSPPISFQPGNIMRGTGAAPSEDVFPTLAANHGRGNSDQDPHVVAFTQNSRHEVREIGGDGQITGYLAAEPGAQQQAYIAGGTAVRRLTPVECSRLQGFPDDYLEVNYANAEKAHAVQILHELWKATPTLAREGWRPSIIASLLTPEILLTGVYVGWISWEMAAECSATRRTLSGEKPWTEGFVQSLRFNSQHRQASHRRESFEQCARQLGRHLSELPLERAQAETALRGSELWKAAQKEWPLRYAFAKKKSGENCITPDGPQYKSLGNSMAVPVMAWIGQRIEMIDKIPLDK